MSKKEKNFTDAQMLRMKAEEKLTENEKATNFSVTEPDVKKLLHELQVHQIELEMQNEELHHANETAEAALEKYTMLYDFAPTGYFTLDSAGKICDLNFTGAEILGERRFSLENTNFKLFVSDESKPVFNAFFSDIFASKGKKSCKVMLGYDNNSLCHVYMEGLVVGDDKKCLLSIVDMSSFNK